MPEPNVQFSVARTVRLDRVPVDSPPLFPVLHSQPGDWRARLIALQHSCTGTILLELFYKSNNLLEQCADGSTMPQCQSDRREEPRCDAGKVGSLVALEMTCLAVDMLGLRPERHSPVD